MICNIEFAGEVKGYRDNLLRLGGTNFQIPRNRKKLTKSSLEPECFGEDFEKAAKNETMFNCRHPPDFT